MLPEQKAYLYAWVDAVIAAGFRAGMYCSGIARKMMAMSSLRKTFARTPAGARSFTGRLMTLVRPPPAALS